MTNSIIIKFIQLYQLLISPLIGPKCRFQPTCSDYCIQAFKKFSFFKATNVTLKRVCKCHPWGSSGYDPIPN